MLKMRKFIYIILCLIAIAPTAIAMPNVDGIEQSTSKTDRYIKFIYNKLSFKKMNKLSYATFKHAVYGYFNLREAGKAKAGALLTVCDFSLSSNTKRMWVIDLQRKKVLYNTLVAHGMGSGDEFATKFSNVHESHQSSLGFYITAEPYIGDNGYSLKLHGVDGIFNNNAFDRAVVIHGADYVNDAYAKANKRIGRSHGCPALDRVVNDAVINKIQGGSIVFVYHPTKAYLKSSYWLNNKIASLPAEADLVDIELAKEAQNKFVTMSATNDSLNLKQRITPINGKKLYIDSANAIVKKQSITASNILKNKEQQVPSTSNTKTTTTPVREKEFLYIK